MYYVAIDIAGIGDTCTGAYGSFELSMPSGTAPAVSAANPVRCYLKPRSSNTYQNVAGNCPQSLQAGPHGYYLNPTHTNPPFWPVVQGDAIEVQVPVVSSAPLNGTDQFHGFVQLADGETNPIMAPSLLAIVNPSGSQNVGGTNKQIGVVYANPTITSQTTNGNSTVNANFLGYVENNSNPGTAYAELAKADAAGDCTSPVLFNPTIRSNTASLQNPQTQITGTWSTLYPGGAYCFRIVATVSSGPQAGVYYGNWQYFATAGRVPQQSAPEPVPAAGRASDHGNGLLERRGLRHVELRHRLVLQPDRLRLGRGARPHRCAHRDGLRKRRQRLIDHVPEHVLADLSDRGEGPDGDAHGHAVARIDVHRLERRRVLGGGHMHGLNERGSDRDGHVHVDSQGAPTSAPAPAPHCTLGARSSHVLLRAHRRSQRASVGSRQLLRPV